MTEKTMILFVLEEENFIAVERWGISAELDEYLAYEPPHVEDDSLHLIRFFKSDKLGETGELTNSLPGSTFEHYRFERHDFGSPQDGLPVTVIVGWYW